MKALLLYPSYPDTFWSFRSVLKLTSRRSAFPPLGLLTIAAMMPEDWEKRLVDMNVRPLTEKDIEWADMVFISAMIVQKDHTRKLINRLKAKGKKIVCGGPLFSTSPEYFEDVDYMFRYESEDTFPDFLADLENGVEKNVYCAQTKPDLAKTPIPMWSLINPKDYVTLMIQSARGCPFNCEFCDIIVMYGRKMRTKAIDRVLQELNCLYEMGWRDSIFIVDDNFIGNRAYTRQLLEALIEWQVKHNYPVKFFTQASTNLADDEELMTMMSRANFFRVFLGIETPSTDSLKECHKLQNTERDLAGAVRILHQHGLQVMGGFIVGFDSDNEGIFDTQIRFIQNIGVVMAMVGILSALPSTRLWGRLKAENRLLHDSTGDTDGSCNFIPKMDRQNLMDGYKRVINTIYNPKTYYKRIRTFVDSYKPTVRQRFRRRDVWLFMKVMWRVGILSRARLHYWSLVLSTAFTKLSALPAAVELAATGEHFYQYTKSITSVTKNPVSTLKVSPPQEAKDVSG